MYQEFSNVYDELMKEIDYDQWTNYLQELFDTRKDDVKTILEFGCGTGNITVRLAQKGYQITATDLSESMLTVADEKANEMGLKTINFYMSDMRWFQSKQKFDSVIACCDTVNYLRSIDDIKRFFISSRACLNKEGLLLFDINSSSKYKKIIGDNTFTYDLDDIFCVWENDLKNDENKVCFNLTFFVENEDGSYNRYEESQEQYFYSIEEIRQVLEDTGFKNVKWYDFGTFKQGCNEGDRIQIVAHKKE